MLFSSVATYRFKNLIKIIICFCLVYTPFFANASSLGGWSLGSPVASGASAIVNGTKEVIINGASRLARGTAKITPNVAQVAKVLRGGVAGYALSVAVEQLLGSVSWVLDPANNRIKYYKPGTGAFIYQTRQRGTYHATASTAADATCNEMGWGKADSYTKFATQSSSPYESWTANCETGNTYQFYLVDNPNASAEPEEKYLPLDVVAQQVISNAAAGDASAQQAITAAAQDVINDAENDSAKAAPIVQQLEASKAIEAENTATGEQTQNPDKPNVTNIKLEFPAFCGWAPLVCEAAQTVISFPITLTQWWNTANQKADGWANSISSAWAETKAFFKEETPEKEKSDVEIEDLPASTDSVKVSIGENVCPSYYVTILDKQHDLSPVYLCEIASGMKAFFVAFGFFTASMIVGRRN